MKRIVLLLLLFNTIITSAQFTENNAIYSTTALNFGNYFGTDISFNYIYKTKYAFKFGYTGNIRKSKSLPEDYHTGLFNGLSFGISNPYDQFENYHISFGKVYKLNTRETLRVHISIGLGYSIIKEPENWVKFDSSFLVQNYVWTYNDYKTLSLVLNPKIELPFSKVYGFILSPMLQINKDRIYLGISVGHMFGLLRGDKKQH